MARRTVLRTILVLAATLGGALAVSVIPASAGGGGCHAMAATTDDGDTVELLDACFTPTTLRIDQGDTVTFVNKDPFTHNVVGVGWGHWDDLIAGDAFRATFDEAGVYPYACQYHPGMTGAIVVGDGTGAGNGQEVVVASYQTPMTSPQAEVRTAGRPIEAGTSPSGWILGGAIGLAAGLGAGLLARRKGALKPGA